MSIITDNIDRIVNEKKLDKKEVLKTIGITASAYSQWRLEQSYPRYDKLVRAAAALGVHVSDLVTPYDEDSKKTAASNSDGLSDKEKLILSIFNSMTEVQQWAFVRQALEQVNSQSTPDVPLESE